MIIGCVIVRYYNTKTHINDIYLTSLIIGFFFIEFVVEIRLCLQKCKVIVSFKFVFDVLAEAIIN